MPAHLLPRIAVVGSINMDLVVKCPRLPSPGETIHGDSIQELPGGKGANQAVAAARLGAEVALIGRVGEDTFAPRLLANLRDERVSVDLVKSTAGCSSGIAIVAVESSGENAITLVAGANHRLSVEDVRRAANEIAAADLLMLQLEIPVETALEAIAKARACGTPILLDPAPAVDDFVAGLLEVDYLCPNETEAAALTGYPVDTDDHTLDAAHRLCAMGAHCVVITRGSRGALVCEHDGSHAFIKSVAVNTVDSTAAGDAFAAAFAVRLSEGESPQDAVRYACLAGAYTTSRLGAQIAMPTREDIDAIRQVNTS